MSSDESRAALADAGRFEAIERAIDARLRRLDDIERRIATLEAAHDTLEIVVTSLSDTTVRIVERLQIHNVLRKQ